MATEIGILKIAAGRCGVTLEEYLRFTSAGLKRCRKCQKWKSRIEFNKDSSRGDGLESVCRRCKSELRSGSDGYIRSGPRVWERKRMRSKGLDWCNRCRKWLPADQIISKNLCRKHLRESQRERYNSDADFRFKCQQRKMARKRGLKPITSEILISLKAIFGDICVYCGQRAETLDHIIPVSKGGQSDLNNLVPACLACNSSKKAREVHDWLREKYDASVPPVIYEGGSIIEYLDQLSYHKGDNSYGEKTGPKQLDFLGRLFLESC